MFTARQWHGDIHQTHSYTHVGAVSVISDIDTEVLGRYFDIKQPDR